MEEDVVVMIEVRLLYHLNMKVFIFRRQFVCNVIEGVALKQAL